MVAAHSWMRWFAWLCLLPPFLCFLLIGLQQALWKRGILNTEDLTIAAGRRGTLAQELLNVWTWDAAGGLLCALSFVSVPVGIIILVARARQAKPGTTADGGRAYSLTVAPALTISPTGLPAGSVGVGYNQMLSASGGSGYVFTVLAGSLPDGLNLTPEGVLFGTPLAAGTFDCTVQVKDSTGLTGSRVYTLSIT